MGGAVLVHGVLGVAEDDDALFVAPGFDDDRTDRDVEVAVGVHPLHDDVLGVPLVARGPQPEDPRGQLLSAADLVQECTQDAGGVTVVDTDIERARRGGSQLRLDHELVAVGGSDVEPGAARSADVEAPRVARGGDDMGERHGQVGAPVRALGLVLLEHDRVQPMPALVDPVEAFSEPDDVVCVAQVKSKPHAVDAEVGHEPGDAALDESLAKSGELAGPGAGPSGGGEVEPFGRLFCNSLCLSRECVEAVSVADAGFHLRGVNCPPTGSAHRCGLGFGEVPFAADECGRRCIRGLGRNESERGRHTAAGRVALPLACHVRDRRVDLDTQPGHLPDEGQDGDSLVGRRGIGVLDAVGPVRDQVR